MNVRTLLKHQGDYQKAFSEYECNLRPLIEELHQIAGQNIKTHFVLKTEEEIRKRNNEAKAF